MKRCTAFAKLFDTMIKIWSRSNMFELSRFINYKSQM